VARLSAVAFDVGETLVDETRHWQAWADSLGVPRLTLMAVLGGVIARGEDHRRVFELVRPDLDEEALLEERRRGGNGGEPLGPDDLYADAVPCLRELRARGYSIGLAGHQTDEAEAALARCGLELDFVGSSARWLTWKPSPAFFARVAEEAGRPAAEVAYVGDRVDNDVVPAATAGMVAVFVRRGPWGLLHADRPEASLARVRVDSLAGLPDALESLS
jgi:FMN phosphatase YigB (HAD superfamily)